jgi:hypothetical protein
MSELTDPYTAVESMIAYHSKTNFGGPDDVISLHPPPRQFPFSRVAWENDYSPMVRVLTLC